MSFINVNVGDEVFDQNIPEMKNLEEFERGGLGSGNLQYGYGLGEVFQVFSDKSYLVEFKNHKNKVYFDSKNIRYDRIDQRKKQPCLLKSTIKNTKCLLVGAYEKLDERKDRLIKLSDFLNNLVEDYFYIYDHKGFIFFQSINNENLKEIILNNKEKIEEIVNESFDTFIFNDKDFKEDTLSLLRKKNKGGFLILSLNENTELLMKNLDS